MFSTKLGKKLNVMLNRGRAGYENTGAFTAYDAGR